MGPNYAIQGNILLGQQILDSMEARFLNTPGPLEVKLMAALQGANVPGADTRCLNAGVSSQSAFVRVARPNDSDDALYLDLLVAETAFGVEPIDELQTLFDAWQDSVAAGLPEGPHVQVGVFPNPTNAALSVTIAPFSGPMSYELADAAGNVVRTGTLQQAQSVLKRDSLAAGMYFLHVQTRDGQQLTRKLILR